MDGTSERLTPDLPPELRMYDPAQEVAAGKVWLADYLKASGQRRYVLGLSGGLDSAVVALWAGRAVGPENLTLVALPYGTTLRADVRTRLDRSAQESLDHARLIVAMLPGADYRVIDIAEPVDAVLMAADLTKRDPSGEPDTAWKMAAANAKARMRAVILRTIANAEHGLLLGTENRTEHYLGYFTLGGDEQSDLEVIAPFFKCQVRQIARVLGVPDVIVDKPPTADLWAGQTDEAELGFSYEQADFVLYYTADDRMTAAEVARRMEQGARSVPGREFPPEWAVEVAERVIRQRDKTRYKRAPKPIFMPQNRTHA